MRHATTSRTFACTAVQANLPQLLDVVDEACRATSVDAAARHDLQLITEEACINVMRHGYPGTRPGMLSLECTVGLHEGRPSITLTLIDDGIAFDPFAAPSPTTCQLHAGEREGWGTLLMRRLSDARSYRRDAAACNVLTLVKHLPSTTAA